MHDRHTDATVHVVGAFVSREPHEVKLVMLCLGVGTTEDAMLRCMAAAGSLSGLSMGSRGSSCHEQNTLCQEII